MTEVMSTTRKRKKLKALKLFPDELIDQLLAQAQNKDAESILDASDLAGQLKKHLIAELTHHLNSEAKQGKAVIMPHGELNLHPARPASRRAVAPTMHPPVKGGKSTESLERT